MRSLAGSMTALFPYLANDTAFADPKNQVMIRESIQSLALETKGLETSIASTSKENSHAKDPLFKLMAKEFASDVAAAQAAYDSPGRPFAQHLLRGSLAYCTACHSRTESTTKFQFPVFPATLSELPLIDRMKLYAATRHFDRALSDFEKSLLDRSLEKLNPLALEKVSRLAIAISIRMDAPDRDTLPMIKNIGKLKNTSSSFKKDLSSWETGLKELRQVEKTQRQGESDLEKAKTLILMAELKKTDSNHAGDIQYLRASSLLHAYIGTAPSKDSLSEALFLLGKSYSELELLGFWTLSEVYFESCIRQAPHLPIAALCYARYADSVELGYSGSAGLNLPAAVARKLAELREMSEIRKVSK